MSQHDYEILTADANTGTSFRAAVNAALQALASNNSGGTAPATPYAYMFWPDTSSGLLKQRNGTNTAWITIGKLDITNWGLALRTAIAGGTGDTITATFDPPITALENNLMVMIELTGGNTVGNPTFAPDSIVAKTIVKGANEALLPYDLPGGNGKVLFCFDASLDKWVLLNPFNPPSTYSTTAQVQGGAMHYAVDTGVVNAYVAAFSPPITVNTPGMRFSIKILNANTIAVPTLNIGAGVYNIVRNSGALMAGDMKANGLHDFEWDGTSYVLQNPILTGNAELADGAVTNAKLGAGAVDAAKASGLFGTWDTTKSAGTVYQAATDLEVHAFVNGSAVAETLDGYTDASNPPTTQVQAVDTGSNAWSSIAICFSVKKNHYWKVVKGANGTAYLRVLPLGS